MSNIVIVNDGSDRSQATIDFSATVGTIISSTDRPHTGPRSWKLSSGNPAITSTGRFDNVLSDLGRRISVWFNYDGGTQTDILRLQNSSGQAVVNLALLSSKVLSIQPTGTGITTDGTTVLSVDTWYNIVFSYTITNTTTFEFRAFLNGTLEASRSNGGTMTRVGTNRLLVTLTLGIGINQNAWYDDIYVDDSAALNDPGAYRIPMNMGCLNGAGPFFAVA